MHELLNKLYRFDKKIKAHKGEPEIETLDDMGLRLLRPLETWDYDFTPLNCSTFATTVGDGVHFSFLHIDGKVTEESPVVMTVPMMPDEPNRIVGANLHEFLSLGCVIGYFFLEQLVYDFDETLGYLFHHDKFVAHCYAEEPTPEDLRDLETQKRLLDLLRQEFDLAPWPHPKKRLRELNKQWLGKLQLRPQEEDDEEPEKPEVVALMKAAEKGEVVVVRDLLKQGMAVNTRDRRGWTALYHAALWGQTKMVQMLLTHGADANIAEEESQIFAGQTPLMVAAGHGYVAIVQELLNSGAEVEAKSKNRGTALSSAVTGGHAEVVRLLLAHGADVNTKDRMGRTPLISASNLRRVEVVKLLLDHGASVKEQASGGETAVLSAVRSADVKTVQLLLTRGASATPKALMIAAAGGHSDYVKVVRLLLEQGVRVNTRDAEGWTPLMYAAMTGHAESVKILLARGANPTLCDAEGKTALAHATDRRRISVMQVFAQAGIEA